MVHFVHLFSAAALLSVSSAAPMVPRDSAIGMEEPVSAPNGSPMSDPAAASTDSSSPSAAAWMPPAQASPQGGYQGGYQNGWNPPPMAAPSPSSAAMMDATSTVAAWTSSMATSSATVSSPIPQMTYGSGSTSWGGDSGYNSCVQQCAASYGQPSGMWTASPTQASASAGVAGTNGVTHTVIVAPSQGVLRYIPFSTNASVGDSVQFEWHANVHTVTRSSAIEVCNKTDGPGAFASGVQNASFTFTQVVNDTSPIWFYCGVPTHCQKGMFGGINIGQVDPTGNSPSPSNTSTSYMPLSSAMANITMMSSDMSAMWSYTKTKTAGNPYAANWGMTTNCAGMSPDAMMQTFENVMYMQTLIAANPGAVQNGSFSVSNAQNMTIPMDISQMLANASPSGASAGAASATGAPSGAAAAGAASTVAPSSSATANGAGSVTSPRIAVGLVAIVATFFAL